MTFIERLKELEKAWQRGFITGGEYHSMLDYMQNRLAQDEYGITTRPLTYGVFAQSGESYSPR